MCTTNFQRHPLLGASETLHMRINYCSTYIYIEFLVTGCLTCVLSTVLYLFDFFQVSHLSISLRLRLLLYVLVLCSLIPYTSHGFSVLSIGLLFKMILFTGISFMHCFFSILFIKLWLMLRAGSLNWLTLWLRTTLCCCCFLFAGVGCWAPLSFVQW